MNGSLPADGRQAGPAPPGPRRLVSGSTAAVLLTACALAVLYGARGRLPAPLGGDIAILAKWLSVALLAGVCLRAGARGADPSRRRLGSSMLLHSIGDVLIATDRLLPAMGLFLLGHLGYVSAFLPSRTAPRELTAPRRVVLAGLALHGVWTTARLLPHLPGAFRLAVPVYAVALLAMAVAVVVSSRTRWPTLFAALLYVFSDTVIAWHQFLGPVAGAGWLDATTWPTYFLAQLLFTLWALGAGGGTRADSVVHPTDHGPMGEAGASNLR